MIPNKNLAQDDFDEMDVGEEDNAARHNIEGYISDSHFIPSEDQGVGDKYKQEIISQLLQSGKEAQKKKKPNIKEISNRLYGKPKLEPESESNDPNDHEKIGDFKKATAMVFLLISYRTSLLAIKNSILSMKEWRRKLATITPMLKAYLIHLFAKKNFKTM